MSSSARLSSSFDALIIGAGHNGLTCACYLAKAGLKVAVFERRHLVGGAAVTEEFHPGFRNSTASYTVSLLNPKVIRDLRLVGARPAGSSSGPYQNFLVLPDGDGMLAGPGLAKTAPAVAASPAGTRRACPDYFAMLDRAVHLLRDTLLKTPPTDLHRLRDIFSAISFGRDFRALPLTTQREIHAIFTRSAGEMLDNWFESDPVKALYGFDAVVGNYASPYTPGSAYVLLHHAFGEVNGKTGVWGHAVGGMGAITQAMAREAERLGVHIELEAPVRRVLTEAGHVARVSNSRTGGCSSRLRVAANVGPKLLFLKMVDRDALPPGLRRPHGGLALRLGGVPDERRPVGTAPLRQPAGRRPPGLRHHHRPVARLHGPGLRRRAAHGHVPGAGDRDADPLAPGRQPGAEGRPRGEPVLPALRLQPAGRPQLARRPGRGRGPDHRHGDEATRPTSGPASSAGSPCRPWTWRSALASRAATSSTAPWAWTSCGRLGPALGYGDYRTPVQGLFLCGSGAHPGAG